MRTRMLNFIALDITRFSQSLSCTSRNNFHFINDFSRRDCVLRYVTRTIARWYVLLAYNSLKAASQRTFQLELIPFLFINYIVSDVKEENKLSFLLLFKKMHEYI